MTMCFKPKKHKRQYRIIFISSVIAFSMFRYFSVFVVVVTSRAVRYSSPNDPLAETSWLQHLCPNFQLQDTANHSQLSWHSPKERTIFFTQTSCGLDISGRQACAVESASRHHPNRTIMVLVTAPSIDVSQPLIKTLLELQNVDFSWLDLDKLFMDSPLQSWHKERRWLINEERSSIFLSDAARVALLQHYGGTYLDMDALSLRPLPDITNYLGWLDAERVNGAVMSLRKDHPLLRNVLEAIPRVFDPFLCCTIGPDLLTSEINRLCPGNLSNIAISDYDSGSGKPYELPDTSRMDPPQTCTDITVFSQKMFYPFGFYLQRYIPFLGGYGYGKQFLKTTGAYQLHLYNSLTGRERTGEDGDSILEEVMKRHCPNVYRVIKDL